MGFFDKFFGKQPGEGDSGKKKGNQNGESKKGDDFGYKKLRVLTELQNERIEKSTILLRTGQVYMHYWEDNLVCPDRDDQEWQNKVMFFWYAEEPFPRKSLPPYFETMDVKHFLFKGDVSKISLTTMQAIPWFGMPGNGTKHVCEINGISKTVPELYELGNIEYIEQIELTNDNLDILTDRKNYMFLIDDKVTPFKNGSFYLDEKPIPISIAYSVGGIHIIKMIGLED